MQLPVDFKALYTEAMDIQIALETEISVSMYIDDTASADVVGFVRNAFASSLPNVRMTITYLDRGFTASPLDDLAVIVAGSSELIGAHAAELRKLGVPVMVVTSTPNAVNTRAMRTGHPIPEGDVIAPKSEFCEEPVALVDENVEEFSNRMGRWIVAVSREKRLAYAIAFPFVRRPLAREAVTSTAAQNAGIGLVSFIPGADLPIMTLNQAKMVLQIAAAYGQEINKNRLKELAAVIGGAYLCRTLARELVEFVPVLGFLMKSGVAYGGTAAMGYAAIEYFEGGENVVGLASVLERATSTGMKAVSAVRAKAGEIVPALTDSSSTAE